MLFLNNGCGDEIAMRLKVKAQQAVMAGLAVLAVAVWLPASGQSTAGDAPNILIAATNPRTAESRSGEMVREIDDPCTGDQWILMRDPVHPEGPGRLALAAGPGMDPANAGARDGMQPGSSAADRTRLHPVIHAGDVLIVEEHTAVVEARLEAVALGPAAAGAIFRARLKIGGKVVRAVAVSAGRAVFAPEEAARP